MNRLLFIIMAWLSTLTALAQTEGYDPSNPPLPNFPTTDRDTTHYYTLRVVSSPATSGLNTTGGNKYTAGQRVYLSAGQNNGMKFQYWVDGEGNTLSTSTSFYYTMPAHNVVITAVFKYQPGSPSLPAFPEGETPTYLLSTSTKPAGAGSFSGGGRNYQAGAQVSLTAYTNTNFEFVCWTNAAGDTLSTARNLYYTMPAAPVQLYGHYRYNPSSPKNPGRNAYDADEGIAIIDDFTPGNVSGALNDVTGGNTSALSKIIVAGNVNSNDFQIANNFSTCAVVDLSRTYGITTVPGSCWYGNDHLTRIMLPSCITRIGYSAFNGATALAELTCLATTPPALDSYVFDGVNKGLVVFVPKASVEIYEQAEGWKDYVSNGTIIIMPVQHNVASLEVNLPEACADGRYKNMPLELINVKTGQRYRYVVTDRLNYTFNTLMRDTRYVAVLRNQQGTELARTDTVKIELESQSIAFNLDRMKQLRTVAATITAGATDITAQSTVNWLDASGNYLAQGNELTNQVAGTAVMCAVSVPQSVAMQYALPADTLYQVVEADNALHIALQPLPALTLTGRVIDRTTQQGVSGVTVTMSQTLNSRYTKAVTARTDQRGQYTLSGYGVPSVLTYALTDYVSRTDTLPDSLQAVATAQLPDVLLKPIQGARITTRYAYTSSVAQGVQPEVKDYYDDYQNVSYTIYNQTAQRAITHFNVQYPDIVLLEDVNESDSLTITASSKTDAFMPVTTGGRITADLALTVEVPITQLGGIRAVYTTTENPTVLAILYDAQGNLLNRYTYPAADLTISGLKDGEYTLVTMGQSDFFNSVYNLSQFDQAGLINGTDYVANRVTVRSGLITPAKNAVVPYFDESKFYYTGANTSFTANKSSIVAGNYLTLTAKVDFKSVYRDNVSGVKLQFELPEGTNMVDGSLMIGSTVSYYQLNGRTITVPLDNSHITDRVRFCVIPTQSGTFAPNASVAFRLKGKDMVQPIGSAQYAVQDVSIRVPLQITQPEFAVSGTAVGRSEIDIFDGNTLLGHARALANGYWSAECTLDNPYNLSEHNIYAKITTPTGLALLTETKSMSYDANAVDVKGVNMSFYNGWLKKNIEVYWDFEKKTTSSSSYMFYTGTDLTFTIDLTNNDTTLVQGVKLNVYTNTNEVREIDATYNDRLNKWVAVERFESNNLPINLSVDVLANNKLLVDRREFESKVANIVACKSDIVEIADSVKAIQTEQAAFDKQAAEKDELLTQLIDKVNAATTLDESRQAVAELLTVAGTPTTAEELKPQLPEQVDQDYVDDLTTRCEALLMGNSTSFAKADSLANAVDSLSHTGNFDCYMAGLSLAQGDTLYVATNEGSKMIYALNPSNIDFSRFATFTDTISMPLTDNSSVVIYISDRELLLIDSVGNRAIAICDSASVCQARSFVRKLKKASDGNFITAMNEARQRIEWLYKTIASPFLIEWERAKDGVNKLRKAIDDIDATRWQLRGEAEGFRLKIADIEKHLAELKANKTILSDPIYGNADPETLIAKLELERRNCLKSAQACEKKMAQLQSKAFGLSAKVKVAAGVAAKLYQGYQTVQGLYNTIAYIATSIKDYGHWHSLINRILPCPADNERAIILEKECKDNWHDIAWVKGYYPAFAISGIATIINGGMLFKNPAAFWADMIVGVITDFLSNTSECLYTQARRTSQQLYPIRYREYRRLACKKDKDPKDPNEPDIPDNDHGNNPTFPPIDPIHDPSGYVYEGVSSNRLQGVTATCYYKETVEDMYGDLHENVVLWNAEEYAQQNPLFTDENGMYQWDVPQGLWQVRFEKEGYQPAQSEWLPVPPPQMDVNIGMVQNSQPEVVSARAYEDGVELQFSKYMDPATLTADNIYIKCKSADTEVLITDAQIELLNAEAAIEGSEQQYASRLRLATDRLGYYDEARIIVSRNVQSYAGIGMTDNFEQQLDVEKKVREIVVDNVVNIAYNAQLTVRVAAQPAEAAAGKTITLGSASDLIAATDATELTLDADGHATFTINAQLPGATAIKYAMPDAGLEATTMVNVVDPALLNAVKAPRASRLSGTAVYRGQTIALTTESEGATIYYTTDGSCPCDAATRIKYERPIVINDAVTIKAMAVGINADESDVQTFDYTIRQSSVKLLLAEGWNWNSHDLASPLATTELNGVATRIVTQEREAIADPDLGLVGNLLSINAAETMKLLAPATAEKAFAGEQYNPTATQIELVRGWNWLGYPLGTALSLNDALALLEPDTDDCIETLDGGFATYTADGEWTGSLQLMQPGRGYLYKSGSDKSFAYNAVSSVANAQALYGAHRLQTKAAPYELNRHRYPNMMPIVATLSGATLSEGSQVVALSEGECRGIANIEANGMIFLSVYGLGNETINFAAYDALSGEMMPISNTTTFAADMLGTAGVPYVLHIDGKATGIDGNVTSHTNLPNGIYTVGGQRVNNVTQPGLYIIKTTGLDGSTIVRKQVVK
ncbi:FN3 associated domain-containing protein [uncultured Prevotellamassilia sp.]|uniref:InlB B-repeat-containing protein n=1 Tax=uncultured Prevotellamassilia sp. TaxID=1926676 RepID=UPI0025952DD8|nr:FN3 associated domain-containing protein [uncultured Prevotellamassilia sp.]